MDLFGQPNTLVVTPNQRLAQHLQAQYSAQQHQQGISTWKTPSIQAIEQWYHQLWQHALPDYDYVLLTTQQSLFLWQQVIHENSQHLLNTLKVAQTLKETWQMMHDWDISFDTLASYANTNTDYFIQAAQQYRHTLEQQGWTDLARFKYQLVQSPALLGDTCEQSLVFFEHLELPPVTQRLIHVLQQQGCTIQYEKQASINQSIHTHSARTPEHELEAMAAWAYTINHTQPEKKIICIVPNLHHHRSAVIRAFERVNQGEGSCPIDLSAGKALSSYAVIAAALKYFDCLQTKIPLQTISQLIRSPFIENSEQKMLAYHAIDRKLRLLKKSTFTLSELLFTLKQEAFSQLDGQQELCHLFHTLQHHGLKKEKTSPSQFAQNLLTLLKACQWPGSRPLSSEEYQAVQKFTQLLQQFQLLDYVHHSVHYEQLKQYLLYQAEETMFQPESPKTNIQILGNLEATGLQSDALWVSNFDDENWPPKPTPNPYIPYALQHTRNLPHASAERELSFCSLLVKHYIKDSKQTHFSFAEQKEDQHFQASKILPAFAEQQQALPVINPHTSTSKVSSLQKYTAIEAVPIQAQESIRGGTDIFKKQAICPFQSFASIRLHAKPIGMAETGLDALDKGNLVHAILESFWNKTKSQHQLNRLSTTQLNDTLNQSIDDTLKRYFPDHQTTTNKMIRIEKKRLNKLLTQWLNVEKTRPAFHVIASEKKIHATIEGLSVSMRLDRIDQDEAGNTIIIDYKTSATTSNHWFGPRPREPQLPLYCISSTESIDALVFAQVRMNNHALKGVANFDMPLSSIKTLATQAQSWQTQLASWRSSLNQLSLDFSHGMSDVDPLDKTACQHCQLHTLCRIYDDE